MGFKIRKKGKHVKVEKFIKEIQKTYEETILKKSQEEMKKKYTDRKQSVVKYKKFDVADKEQKLMEKFVGPYKIKKITL